MLTYLEQVQNEIYYLQAENERFIDEKLDKVATVILSMIFDREDYIDSICLDVFWLAEYMCRTKTEKLHAINASAIVRKHSESIDHERRTAGELVDGFVFLKHVEMDVDLELDLDHDEIGAFFSLTKADEMSA